MRRSTLAVVLSTMALLTLGCPPQRGQPVEASSVISPQQVAPGDVRTKDTAGRIQKDPVAYLREVLARADALGQYNLTFYRQERLGDKLRQMEQIAAYFRKQPFSVKFVWDDPNAAYYESVFVVGQNDNKLVVRERRGAMPLLRPTTRKIDPIQAVEFGRARNAITDFGLANIVRLTVMPLADPNFRRQATVRYQGVVSMDPQNRPAYQIRIEHPPMPSLQYTAQDLYIDTASGLPAGSDLYLPGGQLGARYRYVNVNAQVQLTDADFRIGAAAGR